MNAPGLPRALARRAVVLGHEPMRRNFRLARLEDRIEVVDADG